jgi:F-type H+-transporting ATPase subunit b
MHLALIDPKLLVFEVFNFLVLMALLTRFLYRPVQDVLRRRREELESHEQTVATREATAAALREDYEGRLRDIEQQARALRDEARGRGEEEAQGIVAAARQDMEQARSRCDLEVRAARERALDALTDEVLELAVDAAGRVVDGMGPESVSEAYARLAARRLEEVTDLQAGEPVSAEVSPDLAQRAEEILLSALPARPALHLTEDAQLVAGVRLTVRDVEVEASASAALRAWLQRVRHAQVVGRSTVADQPDSELA